jgi:hypothetical protein
MILVRFKFVSSNNQLLVHFHSDFSNSGSGFALNWKAVSLMGCPQQTLTAKEGVLESPNYPDFLLTNLDCTINILAPGTFGQKYNFCCNFNSRVFFP